MGESDTCSECGESLDRGNDHHVSVSWSSVDVRTASKETDTRVFCLDCADTYLDLDSLAESDASRVDATESDETESDETASL